MSMTFWRKGLERSGSAGFSHEPRWSTTSTLRRFLSDDFRSELDRTPAPDYLDTLPADFSLWDSLAQARFIEIETLLSAYLISSQGDRMLMAHSVEGRFPFLDNAVIDYCLGLPPHYLLCGLSEKFVLKKLAGGLIPDMIIRRPKQPYRSPDAVSFFGPDAPEYVADVLSPDAFKWCNVFDAAAAGRLVAKCREEVVAADKPLSNTDNMGFVGILSTQLLHAEILKYAPPTSDVRLTTVIDRIAVSQT
jgi:asparagine synthase (glutamine-hydrolysing)